MTAAHLLPGVLMTAPNSDRQRPARFAAVPCRLPRPFSSVVEQDELTREFVAGVKTLSGLADRIERIANRAGVRR